MDVTVRRILEALDGAIDAIGGWFAGGADGVRVLEPATWSPGFWALVGALAVLLVLAVVRRRGREPMTVRHPEILVTRGELVPDPARKGARDGGGTLTMTVSNLSRYPVQILEVAVRTGGERRFGVTEVSALVPAMGEVDVEARLPVGKLDDGVLDVFAYAAATRVKSYRHRTELVWEPWAKRFKVAPLEQHIVPARDLPSTRHDAIRLVEDLEPAHGIWVSAPAPVVPVPVVPPPIAPAREPRPSGASEPSRTVGSRPADANRPGWRTVGVPRPGPRPSAAGAAPSHGAEDLGDVVIDEGITPIPARSAASERREALLAASRVRRREGSEERPTPGPSDLFALLGEDAPPGAADEGGGRPGGRRPDASRPDASRTEAGRRDVARPGGAHSASGRQDTGRHEPGRHGPARHDASRNHVVTRDGEPAVTARGPRAAAPDARRPPVATPSPTPAQVLALHELLVTDGEIVHLDEVEAPALPNWGAAARASRNPTLSGAGERERRPERASPRSGRDAVVSPLDQVVRERAPRPPVAGGGTDSQGRDVGTRGSRDAASAGESEADRRRTAEYERPERPFGADDGRLAPRRERGAKPLEFPDEF